MEINIAIDQMITELKRVNSVNWHVPSEMDEKEAVLKALMTISTPAKLSREYYSAEKKYLDYKDDQKVIVDINSIGERLMDGIYIYQGDITGIQSDAIVNAANEKMLGCFVPGHHCIDNAIHMSAGLHLRNECSEIMSKQGHDEPTGLAKVTKGYNLPAHYVVHTVGPNLNGNTAMTMDQVVELLSSCYRSILEAVNGYEDIRNIVFCSISTGVYGVPIELASEVALTTIKTYLDKEDHHLERVVIDVFSNDDYNVYKAKALDLEA